MSAPVGRGTVSTVVMAASMQFSTSSSSLCPPGPKILMPLSGIGLYDAEIMTPKVAS